MVACVGDDDGAVLSFDDLAVVSGPFQSEGVAEVPLFESIPSLVDKGIAGVGYPPIRVQNDTPLLLVNDRVPLRGDQTGVHPVLEDNTARSRDPDSASFQRHNGLILLPILWLLFAAVLFVEYFGVVAVLTVKSVFSDSKNKLVLDGVKQILVGVSG